MNQEEEGNVQLMMAINNLLSAVESRDGMEASRSVAVGAMAMHMLQDLERPNLSVGVATVFNTAWVIACGLQGATELTPENLEFLKEAFDELRQNIVSIIRKNEMDTEPQGGIN